MNVTCPACAARYTADEQKLRGKTARMRCRHCDTVWLVSGPDAAAAAEPSSGGRALRRTDDRERRDLFAPRPSDPGVVRQTLRPPPPADETIPPPNTQRLPDPTAARNENSVLFTLAGLTGTARIKTPEPERTPMVPTASHIEEDDGVIDLKALASQPPRARMPVAPLFSEPPPAAFVRDASSTSDMPAAQAKASAGKRMATIAGALAAVVIAGVGLAYAFRGEKPAPVAAAPAPPPPPAVVAPPPPAPAPAPTITAAVSEDPKTAQAPAKGAKAGKAAKGAKPAGKAGVKASVDAAPKPAAPKAGASDPCGCKGDFNCVLACTVKKGK